MSSGELSKFPSGAGGVGVPSEGYKSCFEKLVVFSFFADKIVVSSAIISVE
jgi:hypothetical protein